MLDRIIQLLFTIFAPMWDGPPSFPFPITWF